MVQAAAQAQAVVAAAKTRGDGLVSIRSLLNVYSHIMFM
jgi:hypothetical protein